MRKSTVSYCEAELNLEGEAFDRAKWPLLCDILNTIDERQGCVFLVGGSIQGWKSFCAQLYCIASKVLRPGPMGWYSPTGDEVKSFAKGKYNPLYESFELNKLIEPEDKNRVGQLSKQFAHMSFQMLSGGTKTARQSKTLQIIVIDEAWLLKPGELKEIRGRATSFVGSESYKIIIPTSGWAEGSDCDLIWKESNQAQAHVQCAECEGWFYPDVYAPEATQVMDEASGKAVIKQSPGGLKYDSSEAVRESDGRIIKALFDPTVWYECPLCSARLDSLPVKSARHISTNPNGSANVVAWVYNALLHLPLAFVAREKAEAEDAHARGDAVPLEEFDRKRSLRPWNPMRLFKDDVQGSNMGAYKIEEPWEKEHARFLTIDVQSGFFWWLVRIWSSTTQSRLFACGKAWSGTQLREIQLRYGIHDHGGEIRLDPLTNRYVLPQGCGVAIDGNYDPDGIVKALAAEYHWIVLRGRPEDKRFLHKDGKFRIYSELAAVETFLGKSDELRTASNVDHYIAELRYAPNDTRSILRNLQLTTEPMSMHTYAGDVASAKNGISDYIEHQKAWKANLKLKHKNSGSLERVLEWVQVKDKDDLEWGERAQLVLASMVGLIGASVANEEVE